MNKVGLISILYIALSYAAILVFFGGIFYRMWRYSATPSPLKIALTPHPTTFGGVLRKNMFVISTFASLFKGNRWTWIGGYTFHIILLAVLVRHLRFFWEPVPEIVIALQPLALLLATLLPFPLLYLLLLRKIVDRTAYITSPADLFALLLLILIATTGIMLRFVTHPDIVAIKTFLLGIVMLQPGEIPTHPMFLIHFSLVITLAFYFPFSKLIHLGGIFFSPTMMQVENAREVRHQNPWGISGEEN